MPASQSAPQDAPTQPAPTDTFRDVLHDLVTLGADFARRLHAEAVAQPTPPQPTPAQDTPTPLIRLAAAFDKVARTIRRCIALARSLDAPLRPAKDPTAQRAAARRRIIRDVEDAIQRTEDDGTTPDTPEQLRAELRDRLDDPDLDWDLANRPVADIIADIRRDLGLDTLPGVHPWQRRTPADLRRLHALAAAPTGSAAWATEPPAPSQAAPRPAPIPQPGQGDTSGSQPDPSLPILSAFRLHPALIQAGLRWPPPG